MWFALYAHHHHIAYGFLFMAGRPRHYDTEEELKLAVDGYFKYIQGEVIEKEVKGEMVKEWARTPEPATVTGLALYLGFESRQSVYDYEENGTFSYIIKSAKLKVECEYEKRLTTAQSPTGAIFALKNMGWKDKSEIDHLSPIPVNWHEEKTYETKSEPNA